MKFFVICVVLFFLQRGYSQSRPDQCQMSLRDSTLIPTPVMLEAEVLLRDNPQLFRLFESQYRLLQSEEYRLFVKLKPEEQLENARRAFEKNGVTVLEDVQKRYLVLTKSSKLVIVPDDQGSVLNRMAAKLHKTMGVSLTYNPRQLMDGSTAYFQSATNEIGIPHLVAISGEPNVFLYHEIRHASYTHKLRTGDPSLFEGLVVMTNRDIPTTHPYELYLSFQEIGTYFQDAKYAYKASLSPQLNELSTVEQKQFVNGVSYSLQHSIGMLSFAARRLDHAVKIIKGGAGVIRITESAAKKLKVSLTDNMYEFSFSLGETDLPSKAEERAFVLNHVNRMIEEQQMRLERLEAMKRETSKRLAALRQKIMQEKPI
ncbi:MAG: hypothetical protein RJB66_538 [Pseudomonadota bacterium]